MNPSSPHRGEQTRRDAPDSARNRAPLVPATQAAGARGVGLIEVLVTLLVFSIGILAVTGLQAVARTNNYDALQRTTASWLAHSILASMRANPNVLGSYLVPTSAALGSGNNVTLGTNCTVNDCSATAMANFDLWLWQRALDGASESATLDDGTQITSTGGLSRPSACILGPSGGGGGTYTVVIAWRGAAAGGGNGVHACGQGRGLYGAPNGTSGDERYQRALVVKTFIATPS